MRNVSNGFISRMEYSPYLAKITLDDMEIIQGDPIQAIELTGGANGDDAGVAIGCAVAASVKVTVDLSLTDAAFSGRKIKVELGQAVDSGDEWLVMGEYTVTDVQENDSTAIITAMDPIAEKLEREFEDLPGFDFASEEGVEARAVVQAICSRRGIPVDVSGLPERQLKGYIPEGLTERELLGRIAGLYGKFIVIDREGTMSLRWYSRTDVEVSADDYYDDGMEKAGHGFRVGWLKCYNEILEETMIEGNPEAEQGIYFVCPWMTDEILASIWEEIGEFEYAPVAELSFLGDPRLDPGDLITLKNLSGAKFTVPVMGIFHEYDGGLITTVTAQGQSRSDAYEGPVQRETKRTMAKIVKRQEGIEMSVESVKGDLASVWIAADEMYAELESTKGDISSVKQTVEGFDTRIESAEGNASSAKQTAESFEERIESAEGAASEALQTAQGFDQRVTDAEGNASEAKQTAEKASTTVSTMDGRLTKVEQTAGKVSVEVKNENGDVILSTYITEDAWSALRTEGDVVTSGFYFDFELGRFMYKGAGEFYSADGTTFVRIEGNRLVLYSQKDTAEPVEKLSIGFITGRDPDNTYDVDYPFIELGASDNKGQVGLVKKFWDGMWIGNSYPKNDSGRFQAKENYGGFFINTVDGKSYVVFGENMQNVYTGEAIAKFR